MKSLHYLPTLITGPNLNIETDRSKIIKWFRNKDKEIKLVFPDELRRNNDDYITNTYSDYLVNNVDSFEYVLSRISLQHFNVHISPSAIFELGQFHSLIAIHNTTVLLPIFKDGEAPFDKYVASEYIHSIYRHKIHKYLANVKIDKKNGVDYYPDALWSTKKHNIYRVLAIFHNKMKGRRLSFALREYNKHRKYFYDFATLNEHNQINLPLKQFFIFYFLYVLQNWGIFSEELRNKNIRWSNFSDVNAWIIDIFKECYPGFFKEDENPTLKIIFSSSRVSQKNMLISFDWIILKMFKTIIHSPTNRDKYIEELQDFIKQDMSNIQEYQELFFYRKNKEPRKITTYSENIYGDQRKKTSKIIARKDFFKFSSENSFAYQHNEEWEINQGYLEAISRHKKQIESNNYNWLKIDIKDFFNSIKSFIKDHEIPKKEYKQGTVLAPLISNLYMKDIDKKITNIVGGDSVYTRYSDDILITTTNDTINELTKKKDEIIKILNKSNLEVNNLKTKIGNQDEDIKYLGIKIYKGKLILPVNKANKIVKWLGDPKKYGLTMKWISNYIENLKKTGISYRNNKFIENKLKN